MLKSRLCIAEEQAVLAGRPEQEIGTGQQVQMQVSRIRQSRSARERQSTSSRQKSNQSQARSVTAGRWTNKQKVQAETSQGLVQAAFRQSQVLIKSVTRSQHRNK